jgi:stage II sporulation protein D (peptidoglycan lytic transglycosylase)
VIDSLQRFWNDVDRSRADRVRVATSALVIALTVPTGLAIPAGSGLARNSRAAVSTAAQDSGPGVTQLRVGILRGASYDVTTVPLETYVARVLAGEMARDSPPAALEALVIAIRTYALANRGRHRAEGFDLCDQTHCQVVRAATQATERAAQATAGQVLLYGGAPASIYYSASCGGRTERPSAVWPGAEDPPYLPSRPDDACGGEPGWEAELRLQDLQRALQAAGFRGKLRTVKVGSRNESGRVVKVIVDGLTPGEISGQDLRMAIARSLGSQHVLSTAFELRRAGDGYRFTGRGSGHGVGLCVIGSLHLAARGSDARAILERYFPALTISSGSPRLTAAPPAPVGPPVAMSVGSGILLTFPSGEEGERDAFLALATGARDELAKSLGVPVPPRVIVQVHSTPAEYERATGRGWFTSGAIVGGAVHLMPLGILRDRGMLERTVRRQLAQMLTAPVLADKPLWVKEGAALYFGDFESGPAGRVEPRGPCPTDVEMARPVSAGALADVYARARACFARQIAAGKGWREVK